MCAALVAGALIAATPAAIGMSAGSAVDGLNGPRGVAMGPGGKLVVTQADGSFSKVVRSGPNAGKVVKIGKVPASFLAPAVDINDDGEIFVLTLGGDEIRDGVGTLYRYTPGKGRKLIANIPAFQAKKKNHDPRDQENNPGESNPYGVAALDDGSALVADAAGNDVLRVYPDGKIVTVARINPRTVKMPKGMSGEGMPPAGTPIPSEAVPTAVTIGADGYAYIGELRGFPGTPGKSQIWRVHPDAEGAVCKPTKPRKGECKRYADGLTSIMDLAPGNGGSLYAVEMSKAGFMMAESGEPGTEIGSLIRISHDRNVRHELAKGKLVLPGGVEVGRGGGVFVTTPLFGPGALHRVK